MEVGDLRVDCLRTKPCVACWRGEGRNIKVLLPGRAGRLAAGEDTLGEFDEPPPLLSSASLSSGIWCSAGLYTHKKITYMYVKDNILLYKIEWSKYPFFHGVRYLGTFSPTCAMLSLSSAFTEDAKTKQQSSWVLVCTIQNKPAGSEVAQTAHAQWT